MSVEYVQVSEEEGEETIELPAEDDGTLLLSTLQAQFPGTSGLKYRNSVSNAIRGIRLTEGRLHPPQGEDGWGNQVYLCVFPKEVCVAENKRKRDDNLENTTAKTKRIESRLKCTDLIVLGLYFQMKIYLLFSAIGSCVFFIWVKQGYHGKQLRKV